MIILFSARDFTISVPIVFFFIASFFIFCEMQNAEWKPTFPYTTNFSWWSIQRWKKSVLDEIANGRFARWSIDRVRYTVPSLPRGRDPCLCWSTVGVALSQALLSASSMKSAIARNCLELVQSNHPPFPVHVRVYINH